MPSTPQVASTPDGTAGPEQIPTKALQETYRPTLKDVTGTAFGGKITCRPQGDLSAAQDLDSAGRLVTGG